MCDSTVTKVPPVTLQSRGAWRQGTLLLVCAHRCAPAGRGSHPAASARTACHHRAGVPYLQACTCDSRRVRVQLVTDFPQTRTKTCKVPRRAHASDWAGTHAAPRRSAFGAGCWPSGHTSAAFSPTAPSPRAAVARPITAPFSTAADSSVTFPPGGGAPVAAPPPLAAASTTNSSHTHAQQYMSSINTRRSSPGMPLQNPRGRMALLRGCDGWPQAGAAV